MSDAAAHFEATDFADELPTPGVYESEIVSARWRRSERGNDMIQVVHALAGAPPGNDHVSEYFVIAGSSPRGRALSRRRLVELYRACGLEPAAGDGIETADLLGARLEVRVEHETYEGRPRLRVAGHRRPGTARGSS
jgi:hypothetical protein